MANAELDLQISEIPLYFPSCENLVSEIFRVNETDSGMRFLQAMAV